jgi:hypothetical protein
MSARPPTMLKLSTVNLSVDGTRVAPGEGKANLPVTQDAALAALKAFASLPAMEIVDAEAKIYLAGPRGKVAVQNERGRLFVAFVPESVNTVAEHAPEEIIAMLTADDPAAASAAASAAAAQDAALIAEAARPSGGLRGRLSSKWTVAVLTVVAAIVAYVSFAPDTPEGVEIISAPARLSGLHAEFNGRYGSPAATILVLDNGHLTGLETASTGGLEKQLFEKSYRFGLREDRVILVVDNGALIEPQPDGSLKSLGSTYPRQAR